MFEIHLYNPGNKILMYHKHQLSSYRWNIQSNNYCSYNYVCSSYVYIFTLYISEIPPKVIVYPQMFIPKITFLKEI